MLHEQSMIANLHISAWTARKYDRKVTEDVDSRNHANEAGRYNKLLIDKDALKLINQLTHQARDQHYELTMPWGDNGDRLLPAALFMTYTSKMRSMHNNYDEAVRQFCEAYPTHVAAARRRLGDLYDPADYPSVAYIRSRFGFHISYAQVSNPNDFRVKVGIDAANAIKAQIAEENMQKVIEGKRDLVNKMKEMLERVAVQCAKDKPIIRDSLMESPLELADRLPAFNLDGDPHLEELAETVKRTLVSPDMLRNSDIARKRVGEEVQRILENLPPWMQPMELETA